MRELMAAGDKGIKELVALQKDALGDFAPKARKVLGAATRSGAAVGASRPGTPAGARTPCPRWLTRSFSSRGTSPNVRPNGG